MEIFSILSPFVENNGVEKKSEHQSSILSFFRDEMTDMSPPLRADNPLAMDSQFWLDDDDYDYTSFEEEKSNIKNRKLSIGAELGLLNPSPPVSSF